MENVTLAGLRASPRLCAWSKSGLVRLVRPVALGVTLAGTMVAGCAGGSSSRRVAPTGNALSGSASASAAGGDIPIQSTVKATIGGDFCKQVATAVNAVVTPGNSPDKLRAQFEAGRKQSRELVDTAPAEIKADLGVMLDLTNKLGEELAKVNYDFTKISGDAVNGFTTPEVQTAIGHVSSYVSKRCGFDLGGGGSSRTTAP